MVLKIWNGGQSNSLWSNPLNWAVNALPTNGDDIAIGSGFKTIFNGVSLSGTTGFKSNSLNIGKLKSKSSLQISSGTLTASSTFTVDDNLTLSGGTLQLDGTSTVKTFTQSGGILQGSGTLTITSTAEWTGGTQQGTGTTEVDGLLTLSGFDKTLGGFGTTQARTLNIDGGAQWISDNNSSLYVYGGSTINNRLGSTFNIINDGTGFAGIIGSTTGESFNNAGTLIKSGGGDNFTISTIFNNSGTATINSGTLTLSRGGEHSGVFNGTALLHFNGGTHNLNSGSQVTISSFLISGGIVNIQAGASYLSSTTNIAFGSLVVAQGATFKTDKLNITNGFLNIADATTTATIENGNHTGGIITGAGKILVNKNFRWAGGRQQGTGTTEIDGLLTFDGIDKNMGVYGSLEARTLNIDGGAEWINNSGLYVYSGSTINNRVGSTFNIMNNGTGSAGIYNFSINETFNNAGTLIKSGDADNFTISPNFNNSGQVEVRSGKLTFLGSYTQSFGDTRLNGGSIAISSSSTLKINEGTLSGFGTITGQVNNAAGTVTAGLSAGDFRTLDIIGNYTETNASAINVEIGSLTNFDKLNVNGTGYFDGTVNVSVAQGYTPNLGDSFDIITYNSAPNIANNLSFNGLNLGNGLTFKPVFKSNALSLTVVEGPTLSIDDVSVVEGDGGMKALTFSVSLKGNTNAFTVDFGTADGTATLFNKDYIASKGTLSFAGIAGEVQKFTVNVKGDTQIEPEQNLLVNLTNLSSKNVSLIKSQGVGTILNDDTKEGINGTSGQDILIGTTESELITGFEGFDTLISNGGNDEFVYKTLGDSPDLILDFELGRDTINILDVLKNNTNFVPGTQDPITLGYVKVNSFLMNNYVYIDSDGGAGANNNLNLLTIVQGANVNATTLSNPDNFVYSI